MLFMWFLKFKEESKTTSKSLIKCALLSLVPDTTLSKYSGTPHNEHPA